MNNYRSFSQLRVNKLTVIKHGCFKPWYEFTDGQFSYGALTYTSWTGCSTTIETADNSWTVTSKGIMNRTWRIIQNNNSAEIGQLKPQAWAMKIKLILQNGFEVILDTKKMFTCTCTLYNEQQGDILNIKQNPWKFKTPFTITLDPLVQKTIDNLPLLIILSTQMVLLRRQRAAAAAQ